VSVAADRRAARWLLQRNWRRHQAHWWRRPGDETFYDLASAIEVETLSEDRRTITGTAEVSPLRRPPSDQGEWPSSVP
jgi:hypothetical protein